MISKLINHIQNYVELNDDQIKTLELYVSTRSVSKKELLLKAGEVCPARYFVVSGCLHLYSIHDDGKEQIIQFAIANWWIADFSSLEQKAKSLFNIEATENSVIVVLTREDQEDLFRKIPPLEKYFRIICERAYAAALWRINHIFCKTGAERYDEFTRLFPGFVQKIPQYKLASFLGITPEFLSMIRAKTIR